MSRLPQIESGSASLLPRTTLLDIGSITQRNISLLGLIDQTGSISRAAKELGISYKSAWDTVESINNLAEQSLVSCLGDGTGTRLTTYGRRMLQAWQKAREAYQYWLNQDAGQEEDLDRLIRSLSIRSNAQNRFCGRISSLEQGPINAHIKMDLGKGLELSATMTRESLQEMGLGIGDEAIALIKASFVLLALGDDIHVSARNQLPGRIHTVIPGPAQSEVKVQLSEDRILTSTLSNDSVTELDLHPGQPCTALIKASHVIIIA